MLILAHIRIRLLSLLRTPAYVVGTLIMPSLVLVFLGSGLAKTTGQANGIMAALAVFAVMGIAFFQFGVGIAEGRASAWSIFERILPVPLTVRLTGSVVPAILFAIASAGLVIVVAHLLIPVSLDGRSWFRFCAVLLAGSIPLALLGVAIGYWVPVRAAMPLANVVYFGLAFGGGLFIPPSLFPDSLDFLSRFLISRHIVELTWQAVSGVSWSPLLWLWLVLYSVFAAILAGWGYRRDEGQRYR